MIEKSEILTDEEIAAIKESDFPIIGKDSFAVAVANAQVRKTLEQVVKWLGEECPHNTIATRDDYYKMSRRKAECSTCRAVLVALVQSGGKDD